VLAEHFARIERELGRLADAAWSRSRQVAAR
jgi:hypothetical protein